MRLIFITIIGALTLMSCSVLILNHSHHNTIEDATKPGLDLNREGLINIDNEISDTLTQEK